MAPTQTPYDGRQIAGMDLHYRRSVLVRMTEDRRLPGGGVLALGCGLPALR
jgi:hypothetical protein